MKRLSILVVVLWLSAACLAANCSKCKKPVVAGAKFCANCGTRQGPVCPNPKCGKPITPTSKFCASCGTKLIKDKPKPKPEPKPKPKPKPSVKPKATDVAGKGPFEAAWLGGLRDLLNNGNFENDTKGWHAWGHGKKGVDATGGRDARSAARLEAPAGGKAHMQAYEQAEFAVMPGERYYVEAWCRGKDIVDNGGAYVMLTFQARRKNRWETLKDGSCKSRASRAPATGSVWPFTGRPRPRPSDW